MTYLMSSLFVLLGPLGSLGGNRHINADELAGIGLGAAALIGAVGYLIMRRRGTKQG